MHGEGPLSSLIEEIKFIRLDGLVIDAEVAESQVNFEGSPGVLTFIRDITFSIIFRLDYFYLTLSSMRDYKQDKSCLFIDILK